jgi:hypothetical protein
VHARRWKARAAVLELLKKSVVALGLEKPARQVWWQLLARGWVRWKPLVPEDAFSECVERAISTLREFEPAEAFGDYLEFGVSRGTSMACVHGNLRDAGLQHVRLIGFDSFEGMPPEAAGQGWAQGALVNHRGDAKLSQTSGR